MMGYATTQTKSKASAIYLATQKPKSVPAVIPATAVSAMGSAEQLPVEPSHPTSQASAQTLCGIHLRYALRFAITTKSGKFLPTMLYSWGV